MEVKIPQIAQILSYYYSLSSGLGPIIAAWKVHILDDDLALISLYSCCYLHAAVKPLCHMDDTWQAVDALQLWVKFVRRRVSGDPRGQPCLGELIRELERDRPG